MFKRKAVSAAALLALGATAPGMVLAQESQQLERVEVTGSSIKRISGESALPIQTITAADIAKTGYTTVTDLIQNLPAMQGFTTNSQSVNGGGGGAATASLHALGSSYTLVLLNGRRLAPYTTGSTVNLNSIPLAAIERVEVLSDGASALYGSDAIAGVVNFITKKDSTTGLLNVDVYVPQKKGGGSKSASISKGFGDLDRDKFNVLIAASWDKQDKLDASQRSFSKTGILTFQDNGADQEVDLISSNSVPGNIPSVTLSASVIPDGKGGFTNKLNNFNPYLLKTGACPEGQIKGGNRCFFDYSATVESIPASERTSVYGSGRLVLSDKVSLFSELSLSRFFNDPRYAAPAQPGLPLSAALLAKSVDPYLSKLGVPAGVTAISGTMNLRVFDAGGRMDRYKTDTAHFVAGADVTLGGWDLSGYYTHSQNKFSDETRGGYTTLSGFNALIASGKWDPLMDTAGTKADVLAPIVLRQVIDQSKSSLDVLSVRGSTNFGQLAGGPIGLGLGADLTKQKYSDDPSAILMGNNKLQPTYSDAIVGGGGGTLPFDSTRNSYGLFSELVLPVMKTLELSGSARYDSYDAVKNDKNFDSNGTPISAATQGTKNSSGTYKLSFKFTPMKELLLRGSVGTGFKAPTLANVTSPLAAFGNTGFHACPPGLAAALAALCTPTASEYNIQAGGNPSSGAAALKPEKSKQWTLGFRYEPNASLSLGADLWNVKLKDQINTITENTAFSNGAVYANLFKSAPDPITGTPTLTFLSVPVNTGKANYQGIDIDTQGRVQTPLGRLTSSLRATYMMKADYQSPGIPGYLTSMSKIGADGQVTFRYLINWSATLDTGAFSHTVQLNYKPGYTDDWIDYCRNPVDENGKIDPVNGSCTEASGSRQVKSYTLVDWQTKYNFNKDLSFTFGIKNLFDKNPPFSIIDQSGTGNARGFDGRYTDPIGRQFYLVGNYKF
ncbi:TonB-dependent receptor [Roseateles sp. NT4]|uniref:TonB-dependent receptor n=1 Tax=Roseateles sp. NT4 TaxID=3453715 RepID=UPI003EEE2490